MPWHLLSSPSIQLGTIQSLAERHGIACRSHSFHLQLAAELFGLEARARHHLDPEDYAAIGDLWSSVGAGEWAFARPPRGRAGQHLEAGYGDVLCRNHMPKELRRKLSRLREFVPGFLERCADEVFEARPKAVGFTVTYSQRVPSLALARVLKERDPALRIVLGGAGCDHDMGPALLEGFEFVDLVVRGKIEGIADRLLPALVSPSPPPHLPGLCWRERGEVVEIPEGPDDVDMDELPAPVFDEYFERLAGSSLAGAITPQLPIETSRGCWWGAKSHCTFCGLNGTSMAFRSKSPERVIDELRAQSARYQTLEFTAVDNILDMSYFRTLLPALRDSALDLRLFYEVKANLTLEQVVALHQAGVRRIQPGIESLSTEVLRLMKKGTTALQNIRLLKWCRQLGIDVDWNLLYGFPNESPEEYRRMAELVPSLTHLTAPRLIRIVVDRFSPYHDDPERHGLRIEGPMPYAALLYDVAPDVLERLSTSFLHSYLDGRDPSCYVGDLRDRIETWNEPGRTDTLIYRRGPGFLTITDQRRFLEPARYTLDAFDAAVYLASESGSTVRAITARAAESLRTATDEERVRKLLEELRQARLVFEEDGRYLALAVSAAAATSVSALSCAG